LNGLSIFLWALSFGWTRFGHFVVFSFWAVLASHVLISVYVYLIILQKKKEKRKDFYFLVIKKEIVENYLRFSISQNLLQLFTASKLWALSYPLSYWALSSDTIKSLNLSYLSHS